MKHILLLLILLSFNVYADTKSGSFTSPAGPQGREDNTELLQSDIKGFQVYVDGAAYYQLDALLSATASTFTITVDTGAKELTMTTIDTDNRESNFSNIVDLTSGKGLPDPPFMHQIITITVDIVGAGQ